MKEQKIFNKVVEEQKEVCSKYGSIYLESPLNLKVGISLNVKDGVQPIHGLRHSPIGDTTGWYIWSGEYSDDPNFFVPLHVEHLREWQPLLLKYLGLNTYWRFLVAEDGNYEDVWFDENLKLNKTNSLQG